MKPFKKFMELLAPQHCLWCQMRTYSHLTLCDECIQKLPYNQHACQYCALPLHKSNDTSCCHKCITQPWPFDHVIVPLRYELPISSILTELKFKSRLSHSQLMSELLYRSIETRAQPDLIIPVPLHANRLRRRGFNQALEISKVISRRLKIPIDTTSLQRIKKTKPQSLLSNKARKHNISKAFILKKKIKQKHIVLVDDILTTGNTVLEIYRQLSQQNKSIIDLWCCARSYKK